MKTRIYELMFIVDSELSEERTETIITRVRRHVTQLDGEVLYVKSWGLRRLAYKIQKQREGQYYLMFCALPPQKVAEFERNLMLIEGVLRELITRPPALPEFVKQAQADQAAAEQEAQKAEEEETEAVVDDTDQGTSFSDVDIDSIEDELEDMLGGGI